MNKIVLACLLSAGLLLGGCANLKIAWQVATSATVSPTQIIVASNAFDALEATATQYLIYCKGPGIKQQVCALGNRKPVVKAVRAGRTARNGLEPYVTAGTAGPSTLYNTLVAAITTLQGSSMPTGGN